MKTYDLSDRRSFACRISGYVTTLSYLLIIFFVKVLEIWSLFYFRIILYQLSICLDDFNLIFEMEPFVCISSE